MEKHYIDNIEDSRAVIFELESSNQSQSYTEVRLQKELEEARTAIEELRTNNQNTSIKSQQVKDNEIEDPLTNNPEDLSLVWDNSTRHLLVGQQKEISNPSEPHQDLQNTKEKEDTKIYENTKQTNNENHKNELLEIIGLAREDNLAELNMTLRSKEKLKEPIKLKDYIRE